MKYVFTLSPVTAVAIHQLAIQLLQQPKSFEKLVALHTHINNFAISTTAKNFNIPTSTLRYYTKQIANQLQTPTKPAREQVAEQERMDDRFQRAATVYSWEGAAD